MVMVIKVKLKKGSEQTPYMRRLDTMVHATRTFTTDRSLSRALEAKAAQQLPTVWAR